MVSPIKRAKAFEYPHAGPFTWEMVFKKSTPYPTWDVNNSIQIMKELGELNSYTSLRNVSA